MDQTLTGRVPIAALADVQRFLESAEHLKALYVQRQDIRSRRSRREHVLTQQIETFTKLCDGLAIEHPRLADLWQQTCDELHRLTAAPDSPRVPAVAPRPVAPAAAHRPGAECSPGRHANTNSAKTAN